VLNGIDNESWSPESDPYIASHFSAANPAGKEDCKRRLLEELGLPYSTPSWVLRARALEAGEGGVDRSKEGGVDRSKEGEEESAGRPLLAVVSRLTVQKGLPLILHGIRTAIARGAQVRTRLGGLRGWLEGLA